jgi:hypothetical protein
MTEHEESDQPTSPGSGATAPRELHRHWETWAGLVLLAACGGGGSYLGSVYFNHSWVPAALAGALGGYLFARTLRQVRAKYGIREPRSRLREVIASYNSELTENPADRVEGILDVYFRDTSVGRVLVLDGPRSAHGYLVRSPEQERLMRAFLRMRFFAQGALLVLGLLSVWFAVDFVRRWNHASAYQDLVWLAATLVLAWAGLLLLPVMLLRRVSRQVEMNYLSQADRLAVAPVPLKAAGIRWIVALIAGLALGAGLVGALYLMVHAH